MRIMRETLGAIASFAITSALYGAPLFGFLLASAPVIEPPAEEPARVVTISLDTLAMIDAEEEAVAEEVPSTDEEVGEATEEVAPPAEAVPVPRVEDVAVGPRKDVVEATEVAANARKVAPPAAPEAKPEAVPTVEHEAAVAATRSVPAGAPAAAMRTADDLRRAATTVARCGEPHPDITELGDNHWIVRRDVIDFYTSSMDRFNSLGWSHVSKDDDAKGWYVGGFGCKSVLWKGGLRSRDIVQSVNGRRTNNVLQIFALWTTMKKKGDFEVVVLRKGTLVTLHYKVV